MKIEIDGFEIEAHETEGGWHASADELDMVGSSVLPDWQKGGFESEADALEAAREWVEEQVAAIRGE